MPVACVLVQDQPPENVWISVHARIKATGTKANAEQRAAALRGELVPGHVVMWGNTVFESRSNEGITAQQEEVRREVSGHGGGRWCSCFGAARYERPSSSSPCLTPPRALSPAHCPHTTAPCALLPCAPPAPPAAGTAADA